LTLESSDHNLVFDPPVH